MTDTLLDDDIPEKFKDPQTGAVNTKALLQSYKALEQRLSGAARPPKSPDEYCIDCSHGMFSPDEEVNRRLYERGLSNEQVQEVYNLASEKLVPLVAEMMREVQAEREVEKLVAHFGGPEAWREVSRQLLAFGRRTMPEAVLDNLSSSYEGVLALYKMMSSEEPGLERNKDAVSSSAADEGELRAMMRDPKYWRDKDPSVVEKVTKGFRALYGE